MDFEEIAEKKNAIIGVVILGIIVIALLYLATTQIVPTPLAATFAKTGLVPGEQTTLTVALRNIEDYDMENVVVTITPESDAITITPPTKTEPVMGKGAYRNIDFDVLVQSDATAGSYRMTITSTNGGTNSIDTYLDVKKQ